MTNTTAQVIEPEALEVVGRLLTIGHAHGIGITFVPDEDGWAVGHIRFGGGGGGFFSTEADLLTAVTEAEAPLIEMAERLRGRDG
ncbi:hypothetical protein ASE25_19320 [Terrabacter sp. Root85]|uniref:hypothetical protein n=1 Tax=Terrabacter sp. Root85 TaxID=1736603 RepID=UPI0006F7E7B9|nr:hypothetical protein [Terrabacter sp. Root85]KRC85202.1 hypothetical protein ASE25_19320 [Terrabacter sp. Root85]